MEHSNLYTNETGNAEEMKEAQARKKLFTTLPVTKTR